MSNASHADAVGPVRRAAPDDLSWFHDVSPTWDHDKVRVVGSAPEGVFDLAYGPGEALKGEWWAACNAGGHVVGFGWLDVTWGGDAEILLAVDPSHRRQGVGSFVIERLEGEAARKGVVSVHHTVREAHPDRDAVLAWLTARGYGVSTDRTALRKQILG